MRGPPCLLRYNRIIAVDAGQTLRKKRYVFSGMTALEDNNL